MLFWLSNHEYGDFSMFMRVIILVFLLGLQCLYVCAVDSIMAESFSSVFVPEI
jgi:hypothetical protein